jgi:hypothetical protein
MRSPHDVFTTAELRAALSLVMTTAEADELISSWRSSEGLMAGEAIGAGFTGDTLVLLSLVSEELRVKVDSYLQLFGDDHSAWLERRREMASALKRDDTNSP